MKTMMYVVALTGARDITDRGRRASGMIEVGAEGLEPPTLRM